MSNNINETIEKKNENTTEQTLLQKIKNNQLFIPFIFAGVVLLLVLVPIIINIATAEPPAKEPENIADTGLVIEGSYGINPSAGAFSGSSTYKFDGNTVTNTYTDEGEIVTIVYTYVVAIENDVRVIKLTTKDEDGKDVTTTHEFMTGKYNDTPFISINDVYYYLIDEAAE